MWNDSYRIGVDIIDNQHYQLFNLVENLSKMVESDTFLQKKENCISAFAFLKDYVRIHFKTEENYQESIQYKNRDDHKLKHKHFVETIEKYEKDIEMSLYDYRIIRNFIGMLTAWLITHIGDEDQKFVSMDAKENSIYLIPDIEKYKKNIFEVLNSVVELKNEDIQFMLSEQSAISDCIKVSVEFTGEKNGTLHFLFSHELANELVLVMTNFDPSHHKEIAVSTLIEVANMICSRIGFQVNKSEIVSDFKNDKTIHNDLGSILLFDTSIGPLELITEFKL